jgi:pimeloyl-ACP methyl ester carboxylesterase
MAEGRAWRAGIAGLWQDRPMNGSRPPKALIAAALLIASPTFAQAPLALTTDPHPDDARPPSMVSLAGVPSHGENLLGVFYLAAGAGPHPTVVLMHGFPGFEQNLDLAQAIRRAGWNVLAVHYRGSWGTQGNFSYAHAIEDADSEVAFLFDPANVVRYRIDPNRIVLLGHSMGGYMVASAAAHNPKVAGVVMISAWNIGAGFPPLKAGEVAIQKARQERIARFQADNDVAPLAGCTGESLVDEAYQHRAEWDFNRLAPPLASRPVLVITSNDGLGASDHEFVAALRKAGDARVNETHLETDHAYSGLRVALATAVLNWLAQR